MYTLTLDFVRYLFLLEKSSFHCVLRWPGRSSVTHSRGDPRATGGLGGEKRIVDACSLTSLRTMQRSAEQSEARGDLWKNERRSAESLPALRRSRTTGGEGDGGTPKRTNARSVVLVKTSHYLKRFR